MASSVILCTSFLFFYHANIKFLFCWLACLYLPYDIITFSVPDIALNIDFAPTFLDIARLRVPRYFDGQSLMDPAVGSMVNKMKG